jgi:hypothetical protein
MQPELAVSASLNVSQQLGPLSLEYLFLGLGWEQYIEAVNEGAYAAAAVFQESKPPVRLAISRKPARRRMLVAIELR